MDDDLIEQRFEFHEERLDHYSERLEALEDTREVKHGRRLEWIVIVLVAIEAVVEVFTYFHPHA
ncbi:hypothetical protein [Pararobbsia silviterrae]|uniref:Uncharacterized protein n=1 Tax=Pararobbsia silviterrae TaxID=1792498 RepID=A0A494Y0S1_9BURK|nr:hypothetical protein [Pararobbsia silviterrae]RKP56352.1 hypothetical protein D7S86_08105 [Pararobbsia silviterrae]